MIANNVVDPVAGGLYGEKPPGDDNPIPQKHAYDPSRRHREKGEKEKGPVPSGHYTRSNPGGTNRPTRSTRPKSKAGRPVILRRRPL